MWNENIIDCWSWIIRYTWNVIKSFQDLEVYKEALNLATEINELIKKHPNDEKYLLVDQMKRASRAIAPIIAEGYAKRGSIKTLQKYMNDTVGESNEMLSHLELSIRFKYLTSEKGKELVERYGILGKKMTNLKNNWQNFK